MKKQFLKMYDAIFVIYPTTSIGKYTVYDYNDVAFTLQLLTIRKLQTFKNIQEALMIDPIWKESGNGVNPINVSRKFSSLIVSIVYRMIIVSIMYRMIIDRKYSDSDLTSKGFLKMVKELITIFIIFSIGEFILSLE
eukprot:Gb_41817 [translate_table: standard]